ncbi:beta-ketoacyl synthase N-terminal-like domain-containing protein [Actinomycetes bacterium KLBMP 9797]
MVSATVTGLGLRLAGVDGPAGLARRLESRHPHSGRVEPRVPHQVAGRGLANLPHEVRLALAAAALPTIRAALLQGRDPYYRFLHNKGPFQTSETTAVVWASSTAGQPEYARVCHQVSTLEPGLVSPSLGPLSAYNIPAAVVSIRLGLAGPNLTLTGGPVAGLSAVVEAARLVADGDAAVALAGASAVTGEVEGAACLALAPAGSGARRIRVRHRGAFDPAVLSAADGLVAAGALPAHPPCPVWRVEPALGDFGAASGLLAAACAVVLCGNRRSTVLAAAVEPDGNTAVVEVSSS